MSYHNLSKFKRTRIEILSKMGYSTRQIARKLNHHHSIIARELKRNTQKIYQAESANELAKQRRLVYHRKELKSEPLIQTIYSWIYDGTIFSGI